jgi:hypothetical protein
MKRAQRIAVARWKAARRRPGKYVLSDAFLEQCAAVGLGAALRRHLSECEGRAAWAVFRNPYLPQDCGPTDGIAR